jgi:hypothetical protein
MFDVIWTDPDRELVGERRARKEVEKEKREQRDKNRPGRNSMSTRSSSSSVDKPFGFFGSKSHKKTTSPITSKSSISSAFTAPALDNKSRRGSFLGVGSVFTPAELPSEPVQQMTQTLQVENQFFSEKFLDRADQSPVLSSTGTITPAHLPVTAH